ncbi:MAG: bacteriohemerythrin [Candidatus Goldiibacteriota bacterium]
MPEEFEWKPELSVGIGEIDVQHRKIMEIIREISGESREKAAETVSFLKIYAQEHFKTEEMYMLQTAYPKYKEHRQNHVLFLERIDEMIEIMNARETDDGQRARLCREIYEWFGEHINNVDRSMGDFIKMKISKNR